MLILKTGNIDPMQNDREIIQGLKAGFRERASCERLFYQQYSYFIREGCRKYHLSHEDSFSAYSDAVLSAILNIVNDRFDGVSSLKTYLFRVFSNKCIDLVRKNTINREQVHQSTTVPELLGQLPDKARSCIELLIDKDKRDAIRIYIEKIGEKCREILLLFEDGYSDKEIAEQLTYNNAAVAKTTRLRCIEKLKDQLQQTFTTF
jgi:RNA polymerase sigma factor (sigma-70 family)